MKAKKFVRIFASSPVEGDCFCAYICVRDEDGDVAHARPIRSTSSNVGLIARSRAIDWAEAHHLPFVE